MKTPEQARADWQKPMSEEAKEAAYEFLLTLEGEEKALARVFPPTCLVKVDQGWSSFYGSVVGYARAGGGRVHVMPIKPEGDAYVQSHPVVVIDPSTISVVECRVGLTPKDVITRLCDA